VKKQYLDEGCIATLFIKKERINFSRALSIVIFYDWIDH
jgi:hypothetical protein